jgi:hypothetical protein
VKTTLSVLFVLLAISATPTAQCFDCGGQATPTTIPQRGIQPPQTVPVKATCEIIQSSASVFDTVVNCDFERVSVGNAIGELAKRFRFSWAVVEIDTRYLHHEVFIGATTDLKTLNTS